MFVAILGHTHPETLSQENKQKKVLSDFLGLQSTRILCQFPGKRMRKGREKEEFL